MAPVFWISGREFDALQPAVNSVVGDATGRTKDVVGNNVTSFATIKIMRDEAKGYPAYYFDKRNSIQCETPVNNSYTFVAIYRRLEPTVTQGRLFTTEGNRLFGSWSGYVDQWFSNGWISQEGGTAADDGIEFNLGTNNNGLKKMYDFRRETMPANNSNGDNVWGRVLAGRPLAYTVEGTRVYLYEALIFNRALNEPEIQTIKEIYRNIYYKTGYIPIRMPTIPPTPLVFLLSVPLTNLSLKSSFSCLPSHPLISLIYSKMHKP